MKSFCSTPFYWGYFVQPSKNCRWNDGKESQCLRSEWIIKVIVKHKRAFNFNDMLGVCVFVFVVLPVNFHSTLTAAAHLKRVIFTLQIGKKFLIAFLEVFACTQNPGCFPIELCSSTKSSFIIRIGVSENFSVIDSYKWMQLLGYRSKKTKPQRISHFSLSCKKEKKWRTNYSKIGLIRWRHYPFGTKEETLISIANHFELVCAQINTNPTRLCVCFLSFKCMWLLFPRSSRVRELCAHRHRRTAFVTLFYFNELNYF